jgi:PAS domain S-box-containing protein
MTTDSMKTILVVDDVPENIAILDEILKEEYRVMAAVNGEAALKIARSDPPPDLILLDIAMPGMDGFEVCRNLKEDVAGASIPVIFLTSKERTADETMGFKVGAIDYIKKPVDPEVVKARIESHLMQKDKALRSSEQHYRRLFEFAKDGIIILDIATGIVIDVNPSLLKMIGLSQESFLGEKIWDLGFMQNIVDEREKLSELRRSGFVRYKDQPLETADGHRIFVECMCGCYQINSREVMQLNLRDITAFVAAERERDEFSSRLNHYLSKSPTVTYSMNIKDGKAVMQWASENVHDLLGYSVAESLEPGWWLRNVFAPDRMRALGGISKLTHNSHFAHEYRFYGKDRRIVWLRDEMRFVQSKAAEVEIVGTLTDVSDRKKIELELSLKSQALEAAANAVVITDREGIIQWTNHAFEVLTGYQRAEVIGQNPRVLKSGKHEATFYRTLWETILAGKVWQGEMINKRKSGDLYTEEMTITPVLDESRNITGFIAIKSDVTERMLSRERLLSSLAEKEVLLREIHHRINNNMQLIMSLLNLSTQRISDPALRKTLGAVARRIESMALVHEQFYGSEDMARIDFLLYLRQLAGNLSLAFKRGPAAIAFVADSESLFLDLEDAIPAGLVSSELLTNALTHAYPGDAAPGAIRLSIRRLGETVEISVRDDGIGFPEGFSADTADSFGLILVRTLAAQLRGKVEFRSYGGAEAILRFPAAP